MPINPPNSYKDRWDMDHVRMPCSPSNMTVLDQSSSTSSVNLFPLER